MPAPVAVPATYDFLKSRSSRAKGIASLTKFEQSEQSVHIGITIKKKLVDGQLRICGSFDRYATGDLPEEYTDMRQLKELTNKSFDAVVQALGGSSSGGTMPADQNNERQREPGY